MGHDGIVIITDGDGIAAKVIGRCGGLNAFTLAARIESFQPEHLSTIANLALEVGFGCEECLVVITPTRAIHHGNADLAQRYWDTYWQPDVNPAWPADNDPGFEYTARVTLDHSIKEVQA
jgi:hypothetical protein